VLVNNATILYDDWQRAVNVNLDTVREAFEINTLGAGDVLRRQRALEVRRNTALEGARVCVAGTVANTVGHILSQQVGRLSENFRY
jgi:hypothetical protein